MLDPKESDATMTMTDKYEMIIDGREVTTGSVVEVVNPSNGSVFATVARADRQILDQAVASARAAFPAWAALPYPERVAMMRKIGEVLSDHADEIGRILTTEQGKPLADAVGEVALGPALSNYLADNVTFDPVVYPSSTGRHIVEHRKPLGVVAAITPWNFPLSLLWVKILPALIAGNSVIVKPASTTPLSTVRMVEVLNEILPPGVLNVICGDHDIAEGLTTHPGVDKIAFTGSTATGTKVMAAAAATIKRITLELGGNDPAIVLDDVDVADAAGRVYAAATMNAGQLCLAAKRIFVPSRMYDEFCDELVRHAKAEVVGDGFEPATTMGPIQNAAQYAKTLSYLEDAHQSGTVIAGGAAIDGPGYFVAPTIVRDIPDDARLVREEQFCPIVPVLSYDNIDDVVSRANSTEYGLGGTVWGRDLDRAFDVAMRVESGTVWVNQHMDFDFGVTARGVKHSGLGGEFGKEGFDAFTQAYVVNQTAW
jgi:acyl-CoA reductase-like NAD-dependent aldehyde dehydrogenase